MEERGRQQQEKRGDRLPRCVSFKDDAKESKKRRPRISYPAVDPEKDDYDPTKPEFVSPASREEVEERNRILVEQQIARLESTLVNRRDCKPGLMNHYERVMCEMAHSISPAGSPRGSTFGPCEGDLNSEFNSPMSFYSEDGLSARRRRFDSRERRRRCDSDDEEEEEEEDRSEGGYDEWVLTEAEAAIYPGSPISGDCASAAPVVEDFLRSPSPQDFDSSFSTGVPSEELAEKVYAEEAPTSCSRTVHRCEDDASSPPRSAPASLESVLFAKLGRALAGLCSCVG